MLANLESWNLLKWAVNNECLFLKVFWHTSYFSIHEYYKIAHRQMIDVWAYINKAYIHVNALGTLGLIHTLMLIFLPGLEFCWRYTILEELWFWLLIQCGGSAPRWFQHRASCGIWDILHCLSCYSLSQVWSCLQCLIF